MVMVNALFCSLPVAVLVLLPVVDGSIDRFRRFVLVQDDGFDGQSERQADVARLIARYSVIYSEKQRSKFFVFLFFCCSFFKR